MRDVQLNDRPLVQILQSGEEARPDPQGVDFLLSSWVDKISTCSDSLKLHHAHNGVEDDLEELVELRILAVDSFGPGENDVVVLAIVLNLALNRVLLHLRRVDTVTKV